MMDALSSTGKYSLTDDMKAQLRDFVGGWASEEECAAEIKRVYEKTGYVMDTHTAVASAVYHAYKEKTGDSAKTIIASTASPYKFGTSVMGAIDDKYKGMDDFDLIDELEKVSGTKVPKAVEEIRSAPVLHDTVCETEDMQKTVEQILGLSYYKKIICNADRQIPVCIFCAKKNTKNIVTPLSTGKFYDNLIKCVCDRSVHCAQKQVNTYADHALVPCSRSCAGVDPGSIWKNNNQLEVNKMSVISMKQLLEAGVHFGHQTRRWNPKMAEYIYTERNGIYRSMM